MLVHARYVFPQGLFGLVMSLLLHTPLIVTAEGQDVNISMTKSAITRIISCLILGRASSTVAVSTPLSRRLREVGVRNCVYIPNSVDTALIRPGAFRDSNTVLFVGRLTENKRPLILIRAFEILAKHVTTVRLIMCGDGPLRKSVESEIRARGLDTRSKILGNVDSPTLSDIRSKTGIFVLPSASEGMPMALLEAMAAGQAVVASRNESHLSLIRDGIDGLLFELDNVFDLERKIRLLVQDSGLRVALSRSARIRCEHEFSNEVVARKLESHYLDTLETRNWLHEPSLGRKP